MIRKAILCLTLFPALSQAQLGKPVFSMPSTDSQQQESTQADYQRRLTNCANTATIYKTSAQYRDAGLSPQQSYQYLLFWTRSGVPVRELKHIINDVFFDERFDVAGGAALHDQMFGLCMKTTDPQYKPFQPLN
jgi:hypothetical protein